MAWDRPSGKTRVRYSLRHITGCGTAEHGVPRARIGTRAPHPAKQEETAPNRPQLHTTKGKGAARKGKGGQPEAGKTRGETGLRPGETPDHGPAKICRFDSNMAEAKGVHYEKRWSRTPRYSACALMTALSFHFGVPVAPGCGG